MRVAYLREKLIAGVCCLAGIGACALMWYEAGLQQTQRPLHLLGDSRRVPFLEKKYPESSILFSAIAHGALLLGILGLAGSRGGEDQPEILHGPAFILVGVLIAAFLYQARTVTGVPMDVVQAGFCLAMASCAGLVIAGVMILVRSMLPERTH